MDRYLKRMFDTQEEINPRHFIRIVGQKPLRQRIRCSWLDEAELFARTFGPPETVSHTRYWNFVMPGGKPAFSLFAKTKTARKSEEAWVELAAIREFATAYLWIGDRLGAIDNCDEPPLLLGAEKFVLTRAC
jgi:hypothetical protein